MDAMDSEATSMPPAAAADGAQVERANVYLADVAEADAAFFARRTRVAVRDDQHGGDGGDGGDGGGGGGAAVEALGAAVGRRWTGPARWEDGPGRGRGRGWDGPGRGRGWDGPGRGRGRGWDGPGRARGWDGRGRGRGWDGHGRGRGGGEGSGRGVGRGDGRGRGRGRGAGVVGGGGTADEAARFVYGNYDRYYGYRVVDDEEDGRLQLLEPQWFRGMDVLDIGCNTGLPAIALAKRYGPRRMVGVDIDAGLVARAAKNRDVQASLMEPETHWLARPEPRPPRDLAFFPISCPLTLGPVPFLPSEALESSAPTRFPQCVTFVAADFVHERIDAEAEPFDTILCLSVTKWIQLNWGDDGIRQLFSKVFALLKPGGHFVLEPQAYSTYQRRSRLTETTREHFAHIELRPEAFADYLVGTVGFVQTGTLGPPPHGSPGFQRPILVFQKPCT